jgi:hypothetical protein
MAKSSNIKVAWIGFAGVIIVAIIGSLAVWFKPNQPENKTNIAGEKNVVSVVGSLGSDLTIDIITLKRYNVIRR